MNALFGTCLDEQFVHDTEIALTISARQIDDQGRKQHPFLHAAVQSPRFRLVDPRTETHDTFNADCTDGYANRFFGANMQVDETRQIVEYGTANGSLIVEFDQWASHSIVSLIYSILAAEIYGFSVSAYIPDNYLTITERMSSVGRGQCSPVHVDAEVWPVGMEDLLAAYSNESFVAGLIGYTGRSGLYTSTSLVNEGMRKGFDADFWKDYRANEQLIEFVKASTLLDNADWNSTIGFDDSCPDGSFGCQNGCAKSYACTLREAEAATKECIVVVMSYALSDPGYLPAVLANLQIPAYFCFLGSAQYPYVLATNQRHQPVLFYSYEPNLFHLLHQQSFERVFLPEPKSERVALATNTFGENGFGQLSEANPVDVDFPEIILLKYGAKVLQDSEVNNRASDLLMKLQLTSDQLHDLLLDYNQYNDQDLQPSVAQFATACTWLKNNYQVWSSWLEPLPSCTIEDHMNVSCEKDVDPNGTKSRSGGPLPAITTTQRLVFTWRQPDPDNEFVPYDCDNGLATLPSPIYTSKSCDWIHDRDNLVEWRRWIMQRPECTRSYFRGQVTSQCHHSQRIIHYAWLVPDPQNASLSLECQQGVSLPPNETIPCDYVTVNSNTAILVIALTIAVIMVLLVIVVVVVRKSHHPVVKDCDYKILVVQCLGSIGVCVAVPFQIGKPTRWLCMARPLLLTVSSTPMLSILLARSWMTYRLFWTKPLRRARMHQVLKKQTQSLLGGLWLIDAAVLTGWFVWDPPFPRLVPATRGLYNPQHLEPSQIYDLQCPGKQSNGIYVEMLLLVRALQVLGTLGFSFHNRRAPMLDHGESFWLITASCTGIVLGLLVLAIRNLITMRLSILFGFFQSLFLIAVLTINSLVVVPKLLDQDDAQAPHKLVRRMTRQMTRRLHSVVASVQVAPLKSSGSMRAIATFRTNVAERDQPPRNSLPNAWA